MFLICENEEQKNMLSKLYVEALEITYNLLEELNIDQSKIEYGLENHWNILLIQTTSEDGLAGQACLKKSMSQLDFVYEAKIKISEKILCKEKHNKALNTMIHELLHVIAIQLERKDLDHEGLWQELADCYNRKYPDSIPVCAYCYSDEI